MTLYKLMRQRKDGTLGPLFINRVQRIPMNTWLRSEDHPTKGYARRPGWHCTLKPLAPHLKMMDDRVWCQVEVFNTEFHQRPKNQGGAWVLAEWMIVTEVLSEAMVMEILLESGHNPKS